MLSGTVQALGPEDLQAQGAGVASELSPGVSSREPGDKGRAGQDRVALPLAEARGFCGWC